MQIMTQSFTRYLPALSLKAQADQCQFLRQLEDEYYVSQVKNFTQQRMEWNHDQVFMVPICREWLMSSFRLLVEDSGMRVLADWHTEM